MAAAACHYQASIEIPLSLLVTGAVRCDVLEAVPGLLVPS